MTVPKQTNPYNCGPTALNYFLQLHGYSFDMGDLEMYCAPDPDIGTLPQSIEVFLVESGIEYVIKQEPKLDRINLPILVNVNYENDGDHYMVALEIDEDENLVLWDPYYGELAYWAADYFKMMHYSPLKKLKNWSLYLS